MDLGTTDLLTVAGATVVVTIIVEVLMRAIKPSPETKDRIGPLVAVGVGVLVVGAAALYNGADLGQALLTGLLSGAAAIGLYDVARSATPTRSGG